MLHRELNIKVLKVTALLFLYLFSCQISYGQVGDSSIFKKKTGIIGLISRDTTKPDKITGLKRIEDKYIPFSGDIIRKIYIERLPFGTSFKDRKLPEKKGAYKIANKFHTQTKTEVIQKNLFFKEKDSVNPYLFADNERYLRELPFLKDADFEIKQVPGTDSIDIVAVVKDVFSLGTEAQSVRTNVLAGMISEDNMNGSGNSGTVFGSIDMNRKQTFLVGAEMNLRNIRGTFTSQKFGYQNYYRSIRSVPREENYLYYKISKPLLHRFMDVTYEVESSYHTTSHRYLSDSIYKSDFRYGYYQFEGWLGYNFPPKKVKQREEKRMRKLAGIRIVTQRFTKKPEIYKDIYNWQYANLTGLLGSFTIYRQNFLKTKFVYGFGVNEDIPKGIQLTGTVGYTIKDDISRPYLGLDFQKSNLLKNGNYIEYIIRAEGFLNDKKIEDINLLGSVNYFSQLKHLSKDWKQRTFLSFSTSRQINSRFNEPLLLDGRFAIPQYGYESEGGDVRLSAMAESVFFSLWSILGFKLAPVISFNATAFSPYHQDMKIFTSIGGGVRTRNESLVFGTIELKGLIFPRGDVNGNRFGAMFSSNIEFRRLTQLLRKPDFIQIN